MLVGLFSPLRRMLYLGLHDLGLPHSDTESKRHKEVSAIRAPQSLSAKPATHFLRGVQGQHHLALIYLRTSLRRAWNRGERPLNASILLLSSQSQENRAKCIPAILLHAENFFNSFCLSPRDAQHDCSP
jgi:hypothetical protein